MAVGTGLVALLVAVFAVSQWPRGLIGAPPGDWLTGWLLIGVGCLAGLVVDWYVHACDGVVRLGATGVVLSARPAVAGSAESCTGPRTVWCWTSMRNPRRCRGHGPLPRGSSPTSATSDEINICVDPTHWRRAHSLVSERADTCPAAGRDVG